MPMLDISDAAKRDLTDIWSYIAPHNASAADRLIQRFDSVFRFLAENPISGTSCEQYSLGLRAFSVGSYAVFFRANEASVTIIRVLHGARHMDGIFGAKADE